MTARNDRRMLTVRVSEAGVTELDRIAAREGVTRSDVIRLLLAYGCAALPPGWRPLAKECPDYREESRP